MKLNQLERRLETLEGFFDPSPHLEQYPTRPALAARLLFEAALRGDIRGKRVCDLGCGTGILAIGAAILGAAEVIAVDIDRKALEIARKNATSNDVSILFLEADCRDESTHFRVGACDTVVMNPPFGAQKVHADRPFIDTALVLAPVTYGIFNAGSLSFVRSYLAGRGEISEVTRGLLAVRRTYPFHRDEVREIPVEIMVIRRRHT